MSYIKHKVGDTINGIECVSLSERMCDRQKYNFKCPYCDSLFSSYMWNVSSGKTTSCGCNRVASIIARQTKHGHCAGGRPSSEYSTYREMIERCYNQKCEEYKNYGARGIIVCDTWLESFSNFITDMGLKPSQKHSIDRVDNNGIYEPGNCKWSTPLEQSNNTRINVRITFNGKTQTQSQWAAELGIPESTIKQRRNKGLPVEQILFVGKYEPTNTMYVTYEGNLVKLLDLCKQKGIDPKLVKTRMRAYGYTLEQALTNPKFSGNTTRHLK